MATIQWRAGYNFATKGYFLAGQAALDPFNRAMQLIVTERLAAQGDWVALAGEDDWKRRDIAPAEFAGKRLEKLLLRENGRRLLHVGLGKSKDLNSDVVRQATGVAARTFMAIGSKGLVLDLRRHARHAQAAVEGILLGAYRFDEYRIPERQRKNQLQRLVVVTEPRHLETVRKEAQVGQTLGAATNATRALANLPGNVVTPAVMAERAQLLARRWHLRCRIWDEHQLAKEGFGGILAVGRGSENPPRLIVLEWRGGRTGSAPVVLVGKAITFDSGGISIKPPSGMEEMKFDKAGGCAVLGILQAAAALKLRQNIIGVIPSAENLPDARAYRPGDLVPTYDGKRVEVLSTDAEGRIILADALAFSRKKYRPRLMIDLATLTGACVVALGGRRAGLFTEQEALREQLHLLGEETGDRVWPLPMGDEYVEQIKSEVGAFKNSGGREGGACTAASFLRQWTDEVPWVHLDIAGPAWTTKERPYLEVGATGFGVRLVAEYLRASSSRS